MGGHNIFANLGKLERIEDGWACFFPRAMSEGFSFSRSSAGAEMRVPPTPPQPRYRKTKKTTGFLRFSVIGPPWAARWPTRSQGAPRRPPRRPQGAPWSALGPPQGPQGLPRAPSWSASGPPKGLQVPPLGPRAGPRAPRVALGFVV